MLDGENREVTQQGDSVVETGGEHSNTIPHAGESTWIINEADEGSSLGPDIPIPEPNGAFEPSIFTSKTDPLNPA